MDWLYQSDTSLKTGVKQRLHCILPSEWKYQNPKPQPLSSHRLPKTGKALATPLVLRVSIIVIICLPSIYHKKLLWANFWLSTKYFKFMGKQAQVQYIGSYTHTSMQIDT